MRRHRTVFSCHGVMVSEICAPCCKQFCALENHTFLHLARLGLFLLNQFIQAQVLLGFVFEVYGLCIILRVLPLHVFVYCDVY
jgi:hypothetical protein